MKDPKKFANIEYGKTAHEGADMTNTGSVGEFTVNRVIEENLSGQLNKMGMKEIILEKDMKLGQIIYSTHLEQEGLNLCARTAKAYRPLEEGSNPAIDQALGALGMLSNKLNKKLTVLNPVYTALKNDLESKSTTEPQKEGIKSDMNSIKEDVRDMVFSKNMIVNYVNELFGLYDCNQDDT